MQAAWLIDSQHQLACIREANDQLFAPDSCANAGGKLSRKSRDTTTLCVVRFVVCPSCNFWTGNHRTHLATSTFAGSPLRPHTSHTVCPAVSWLPVSTSTRMRWTCKHGNTERKAEHV